MSPVYSFGARTAAIHCGGLLFRVTANVFPKPQACSRVRIRQPGRCVGGWVCLVEGLIWVVKAIMTNGSLANQPCLLSLVLNAPSGCCHPPPARSQRWETACLHRTLNIRNEGHKNTKEQMDEQEGRSRQETGV